MTAVRDAAALGYRDLVIEGGEPFLHRGLADILARAQRAAEFALSDAGEPGDVADGCRLIEPVLDPYGGALLGRGLLAKDRHCRISGEQVGQGEDDDGDEEDYREHLGELPTEIAEHVPSLSSDRAGDDRARSRR